MAGFRKAKAEQAALKMSMYGPPGSGKTFTALLIAEGLAKLSGKRIAFGDTEHGTDFYCQEVPQRRYHPEAFDFDATYTRSLTELLRDVRALKPAEYGVIVIDSMTHVWEAAKAAYSGKTNKAGQLPMWAWSSIKKPYKELMQFLINSPFHVIICGRQGNEFTEDEATGEVKAVGTKMRAEGETQYEPHICLRMENYKEKGKESIPVLHVEKDRTGILQGKVIDFPNFDKVARPLLGVLGQTQAQLQSEEDAATVDADALRRAEVDKGRASAEMKRETLAKLELCKTEPEVKAIGDGLTPAVKKTISAQDLEAVRAAYLAALDRVKGLAPAQPPDGDAKED